MKIAQVKTPGEIEEARALFREYEGFLGVDLRFQGFEEEVASIPGKYAPPGGALFLAVDGGRVAGCAALRRLEGGVCEMKRLFVRSEWRGRGIGRALAEHVVSEAAGLGFALMRLDTLGRLKEAVALYASIGFQRVKPYYENPLPGVVYWELDLGTHSEFMARCLKR